MGRCMNIVDIRKDKQMDRLIDRHVNRQIDAAAL